MCNGTCTHALSRFPQRLFRQASGGGGALTDRCQHWVIDSADGYTIDIVPAHCAPVRRLAGDRSGRRTRTYLAFGPRRIGERDRADSARDARARRSGGGNTGRFDRLGARPRPRPLADGRSLGADVRRADPRHRSAGGHLRPFLSRERRGDRAVLRQPDAVPGRDAGDRDFRQCPASADLLGVDEPVILPPDRLLAPQGRGAAGRAHGSRDHWRGRPAADCGRRHAGTDGRVVRPCDHPCERRCRARLAALSRDPDSDPARLFHQIGAIPVPFLAAPRDGRAHAGERLSPLRNHGEGGRIPDRALLAGPVGHRSLYCASDQRGSRDHDVRRVGGAVQA